MTEFISRNHGHDCYEIIIKTTDHEHYRATEEFARRLIGHAKPVTNADRIRSMRDEELAAYLEKVNACGDACPAKEHCMKVGAIGCFMTLLEWLRQPCEGGKP